MGAFIHTDRTHLRQPRTMERERRCTMNIKDYLQQLFPSLILKLVCINSGKTAQGFNRASEVRFPMFGLFLFKFSRTN